MSPSSPLSNGICDSFNLFYIKNHLRDVWFANYLLQIVIHEDAGKENGAQPIIM
jgi:hypothetical protein